MVYALMIPVSELWSIVPKVLINRGRRHRNQLTSSEAMVQCGPV